MSFIKTTPYRPVDVETRAHCEIGNPFFSDIEGRFEGPDNAVLRVPGFYAGEGVWKIRFSPTKPGSWTYTVRSATNPDADDMSGVVECAPGGRTTRGPLRIPLENPFHFAFEDGTPHFMNAYECDWLWALDLGAENLENTTKLVDSIRSYGFNNVIMNVYAHDCGWSEGRTSKNDYGPPAKYAWEGTNEDPDHSRINTDFFDHYDGVVRLLADREIMIHLFLKVYNKMVNWPQPYSPEDDLFFRYITARYQAYPNILWDFSKESKNEPDKKYVYNRVNFVKALDAYRHLFTIHDDPGYFADAARRRSVDFFTAQQHTDFFYAALAGKDRYRIPYFNSEFGYEHGPGGIDDYTYGVRQTPEELIRRAYEVVMAGAYPAYYYTNTAWDVIDISYDPPGCGYFRILYEFFTSIEWWKFEPVLELTHPNSGLCLARSDDELVLYPGARERERGDIFLTAPLNYAAYEGYWMDIFSGERRPIPKSSLRPNANGLMILRSPFESTTAITYLNKTL